MEFGIDNKIPKPIFIFSLPRSGSTLLQKMLMQYKDIVSISEPWILLPLISMRKKEGTLSTYNHTFSEKAISDFISAMPKGKEDYNELLRQFVLGMYSKFTNGERYFLDKTPRYYHIIKEINQLLPNAKCIFLIRDPRDVYSSLLHNGRDNSFKTAYDIFDNFSVGTKKLAEGYSLLRNDSIIVKYDDLVSKPETELKRITNFLEISELLESTFSSGLDELKGQLGDKIGQEKYSSINSSSIGNWKNTFNTRFRKKVLKNTVVNIDDEYFESFSFDKNLLINEIKENKLTFRLSFSDCYYYYRALFVFKFNLKLFFGKKYKWTRKSNIS